MKKYILVFVCIFISFDSFSQKKKVTKKKVIKTKTVTTTDSKVIYPVSFFVTYSQSYCGGAAPSKEMLKSMERERPYENQTYYIIRENKVKNNIKAVTTLLTSMDGNAMLQLPEGIYYIVKEEQLKPLVIPANDKFHTYDKKCLQNKWETPLQKFIVTKKENIVKFNEYRNCSYQIDCCQYSGPLPQ
jgi:hypothetical protein